MARNQRELMRDLYRWYAPDDERIVNAFASAERSGLVQPADKRHGDNERQTAEALLRDGLRKGWIHE